SDSEFERPCSFRVLLHVRTGGHRRSDLRPRHPRLRLSAASVGRHRPPVTLIPHAVPTAGAEKILWREEKDRVAWDRELARLGGHPVQSALWGDARRAAEGIEDHRFVAERHSATLLMARMEFRRIPLVGGRVGWIPRGPAGNASADVH